MPNDRSKGGRPRVLVGVVLVLLVALGAGATIVARTFLSGDERSQSNRTTVSESTPRRAESIEAAISSAAQYNNNREYSKAEAILRRTVEQYPQDQPLRLEFARSLVAQQKFAEANPEYQAALALETSNDTGTGSAKPEEATTPKQPGKPKLGDAALQFEAGTIASKAGLLDRAEEHYSMAQSADPTDSRFPLFLGMVQLRLNKEDAAQASLVRCVTLDPSNAAAWGTLAELSFKANQLSLALQHIEKARKIDAMTPRWRLVQAKVLKRRGEKGDVQLAAQLLLAMDRSELLKPDAAGVLAECYGLLSRPADAAALYAEASRADPKNPDLALGAAQWHRRAGDSAKALYYAKFAEMLGKEGAAELVSQIEHSDGTK